ncbi:MAG: hypothetical protein AAFR79_17450 [Pseudomonadota bacterium]
MRTPTLRAVYAVPHRPTVGDRVRLADRGIGVAPSSAHAVRV